MLLTTTSTVEGRPVAALDAFDEREVALLAGHCAYPGRRARPGRCE